MDQLGNNRLLLRDEITNIRTKIIKLDLEKLTKFNMTNPDQTADDVIGGFNAIRAGR